MVVPFITHVLFLITTLTISFMAYSYISYFLFSYLDIIDPRPPLKEFPKGEVLIDPDCSGEDVVFRLGKEFPIRTPN